MSLLMDALKRAEKARQAEDERKRAQAEAEGGDDSQELTLEAMSEDPGTTGARRTTTETPTPAATGAGLSLEGTSGGGDSLTDSDELRAVQADILSGKASLDATLEDTDSWDLSELHGASASDSRESSTGELNDSNERPVDYGGLPLDETNATLPSMRAAQRSVDDYFDGTHSMSVSVDEVRDAVTPPDPGDTDGRVHPDTTRRTARALLDGDLPGRTQRTGVIAALVLIPLLLVVLGGGAYVFKDEIMRFVDGPQTPIARRSAPTTPAPQPSAPSQPPRTTAAAPAAATPPSAATVADASAASAGGSSASAATASGDEQAAFVAAASALSTPSGASTGSTGTPATAAATSTAEPSTNQTVAGTIDTGVGAQSGAASTGAAMAPPAADTLSAAERDVAVSDVLRDAGPDSTPAVAAVDLENALAGRGSPSLKITRRRGPGRIARLIRTGYDAYQAGDDGTAANAYQRVLRSRPNNRDALLGMAAIYMRADAMPEARAAYSKILKRNPRDPAAMAGLLAVDRSIDPTASESQLKTLLADRPQDPGLHFALGNVYAGQLRWAEAQQEFFEAHRYQPDNPDYAFNLAVALDQLRQPKAAANFYQRALELSATGTGGAFDADGVRERLRELRSPG